MLFFLKGVIFVKRIIAVLLSLTLAATLCGCNDKDKKDKKDKKTDTSAIKFEELTPEPVEQAGAFDIEITENTFSFIKDCVVTSDSVNDIFISFVCNAPEGVDDGLYSSPEAYASVNGKEVDIENLAYVYVSGPTATVTLSSDLGYVKKGDEIIISVKNFNTLREPEDEEDIVGYTDFTDKVAIEGSLSVKTTATKAFGSYKCDLSAIGGEELALGEFVCTVTGAFGVFGDIPKSDVLEIVYEDGTTECFDTVSHNFEYDEDGNPTERYNLTFSFSDDKQSVKLDNISDIRLNGKSVMK